MKNLFIIGLVMWSAMQYLFDIEIFENKTHASILYWVGIYLPFLLFTINEIIRRREMNILIFYLGMSFYFIYDISYQISLINTSFDEYENAVYGMIPSYDFIKYIIIVIILNIILFEHKKGKKIIHRILWGK